MTHFTKAEIEEIAQRLAVKMKRDTDFPVTDYLTGDEYVAIVQDAVNKIVSIDTVERTFLDPTNETFLNAVSTIVAGELQSYYTKSETNSLLSHKVDKVAGKGLSTNDYSNAEKAKVSHATEVIPAQASSTNQLADKEFVNSSIETNTATFKGTYNLITDLFLTTSATTEQIATALAWTVSGANNNDYTFVQIPTDDETPFEIARVDRYKFNGTSWAYEWSLNNSSFTADQWAAINSGITSGLVSKLSALPTNSELTTLLNGKVDKVEGKGLSTEDYTTAEKTKLSGIAAGAQVNILEGVQVDGTDLPINNKKVNVVISGKADKVSGATSGNFAGLDANGNLVDSGKKTDDFATAAQGTKADNALPADNVKQITGSSQTDVMSQKAVTDALATKADKVSGATDGNLAGLNASGNLVDTGIAKEDVAKKDGNYPLLTAGLSENLVDTKGNGTEQKFIFRPSAGSESIENEGTGVIQEARGMSVVWNQQIKNPTFVGTTDWSASGASISAADNVLTWTASDSVTANNLQQNIGVINNHKYFVRFDIKGSQANTVASACGTAAGGGALLSESYDTNWKTISQIVAPTSSTDGRFFIRPNYTGIQDCVAYIRNVQVIDLTLMFGSGREPSTVAEFEAMFPKSYYPYATPRIINVAFEAIETTGFNQWDEEWENGIYSPANGEKVSASGFYRSKNYVPVFPSTIYYYKAVNANTRVLFYGDNYEYLGSDNTIANIEFTTPANCRYITFYWQIVSSKNICINLSHSGYRNGEYEAYWKQVRYVPIKTATSGGTVIFPEGLRGVGTVYDSLFKDRATKRLGIVDLGTLDYIYDSTNTFRTSLNLAKVPINNQTKASAVCAKYAIDTYDNVYSRITNKTLSVSNTALLRIYDSDYTDAATFKTAMSGVYLIYELATPVNYTLDEQWNNAYKVADFGTEAITPVEDASGNPATLPIDAIIKYNIDFTREVANLPENYVSATKSQSFSSDEKAQARTNIGASDFSGSYNDLTDKPDLDAKADVDSICDELISGDVLAPYPLDREFTYDQTAGGADVGRKGARITGFKGKTLVWNQLVSNGDFANNTITGWTLKSGMSSSFSNRILTISGINGSLYLYQFKNTFAGHKYYISLKAGYSEVSEGASATMFLFDGDNSQELVTSVPRDGVLREYKQIVTALYNCSKFGFSTYPSSGNPNLLIDCSYGINIIDLTLMFGAGNEPTTAAEFEKFYNKPYYSYNAGALINNNATALETVGFNQWDEEWESGIYDTSSGGKQSGTRVMSKNAIPIFPNTTYCCNIGLTKDITILFYDVNGNYLHNYIWTVNTFTTPANAFYMRFYMGAAYGTTYNHDICINLSSSRNGQYEPYQKNTLTLGLNSIACHDQNNNAVTVTGLDGVRSYYDEGVVENGMLTKIIKRYDEVDLGNLTWYKNNGNAFYAEIPTRAPAYMADATICEKYATTQLSTYPSDSSLLAPGIYGFIMNGQPTNRVAIADSSISTASDFKTTNTGIKLRFILATPVVLTLDNPIPVDYIAGYTEKRLPEDTASAVSAPMEMSVRYSSNAGQILQKIQTTFNNLLNAFKTAGKIASFTNTFDDGEGKFTIS